MPKAIGPSFPDELKVAGLTGLPFSWGSDGSIQFDSRMTQAQKDAVNAVYAAHNPATAAGPSQRDLDLADLKTKIDDYAGDVTALPKVKAILLALKKLQA